MDHRTGRSDDERTWQDTDGFAEGDRLAVLDELDVLDTPREQAFDRVVRLARRLFSVPIAIVSFFDAHRQWYKAFEGVENAEVPLENSFCQYVLRSGATLIVPDATKSDRFASHPLVVGKPSIRFYAGVPLRARAGEVVGTLCIVDTEPREFSADQLEVLTDLAAVAMDELHLRLCAATDPLTGTLSRRAFKEEAGRAGALALRHHNPLSCIVLDLDHFKPVNDTYGHEAGDRILTGIAAVLKQTLRETDILGRLGGEEFAVVLPNTGLSGAAEAAEKLRAAIEAAPFGIGDRNIHATASFGIAALDAGTRDIDSVLKKADEALYRAKEGGRNRCMAAAAATTESQPGRRRVLKSGKILFNGHTSSIDCTVRSLSDDGAGIDVSSSVGVPRRFDLAIPADRFLKPSRVVSQTEKHIELEFD